MNQRIKTLFKKKNIFLYLIICLLLLYLVFQLNIFRNFTWQNYIYIHQDFWRRMIDAQYYLGLRADPQFHPPIPSLIFSLFILLKNNQLFIINFISNTLFAFLIFIICRKFTKNSIAAFVTSIFYLTNYSIINQANYLGLYDLLASFVITLGVFLFIIKSRSLKWNFIVGIILGFAGLIQYSGIFSIPLIILLIIFDKNLSKQNKIRNCLTLILSSGIIFSTFFIYRFLFFGNPLYSQVEHFGFIGFKLSSLVYYIFAIPAFFKIPVVLVSLGGLYKIIRSKSHFKFILLILPSVIFFLFLYTWIDWRFMVYFIPIIYLLFCEGLIFLKPLILKNKIIFTSSIIFGIIAIAYNNLYSIGNFGIITGLNSIISEDINYNNGNQSYRFNNITLESNFIPYFLTDITKINGNDSELNYFNNIVNYQNVLDIKNIIKESSFELELNDEIFVRDHQFKVAFGREVLLNPSVEQVEMSDFIISDHILSDKRTKEYTLLKQFNTLYLYTLVKN